MCSCIRVIRDGNVKKARKGYTCQAFENIKESVLCYPIDFKLTFSEWRQVAMMRENGGRIFKGDSYYWQFNTDGSDTWMFRANKAMHDLCVKYDLYPCEC